MAKVLEFELQKAADRVVNQMLRVKEGETVIITADTGSSERVANALASSAFAAGAKPMVIWMAATTGVGKAADPELPVEVLTSALLNTDVWIEINSKWVFYSTPFERASSENKKLRYLNLQDMNCDLLWRNIGKVDMPVLAECLNKITELNRNTKKYKVTTPSGTDLTFESDPTHYLCCDAGDASVPGIFMMPGQINVVPKFSSVNGALVFDGSLVPPCGLLREPIRLTLENSVIKKIEGGEQAKEFERWLKSFDDPNMLKMAHMAYGLNPGAKLTGDIVEDERVWGCVEWGIGYVSTYDAPPDGQNAKSHCDGICLNASVWLDGVGLIDNGRYIHPEIKHYEELLLK